MGVSMIADTHASIKEIPARDRPPRPRLWVSYYHVVYTVIFCVSGILATLYLIKTFTLIDILVIPATFVVANVMEYVIHRWPMHHRYPHVGIMFDLHMIHHRYFFEENYRIDSFADYSMIVFPPMVLNILAFVYCPILASPIWWLLGKDAALMLFASIMGYYLLMQIIHVATHLPEHHWVVGIPGIRYLWTHHIIHHSRRHMTKVNFNFIVPLTDVIIGTATQHRN
jgi:hypothetical protein